MLPPVRVDVAAGRPEVGAARAHLVDVNAVRTGGQPL